MNLYDIVAPMTMDEAKATKQRLDKKCWKGKHKEGTKVKGGVRVNNCVPNESVAEDAWHAGDNAWSSENHEMFEGHLSVGDPVIVTAPNEYEGMTGEISDFAPSGKFVIVRLYNVDGEVSMHMSDIEYNQYADEEDELEEAELSAESMAKELIKFLNEHKNTNVVVGNSYICAPVSSVTKDQVCVLAHFDTPHKLVELDDTSAIFEVGGQVKKFPNDDMLEGDLIRTTCMFETLDDVNKFKTMLMLKFGGWHVYTKVIKTGPKVSEAANPAQQAAIAIAKKKEQGVEGKEVDEGWQDFNKVEPYAVCLAGKPVKKFDYYEQARRFHDNWKKKLYREGDKAKADTITLMPLNLDEAISKNALISKLQKDLPKVNDPKNKNAPPVNWTGPGKDDYGYTGYQGHGMPTDRAEQARIRAEKKKGVAEGNPWANVVHSTDIHAEKSQREQEHKKQAGLAAKVLKNHSQALDPKEIDLLTRYNLHHRGKPGVRLDNYDAKQAQQLIQNVLRFNKQGVAEDWIDDNAAEPLARYFADLYYGDFSATYKVKLTSHIYQAIQNGELSIEQLKADIDMLEKEKGIKEMDKSQPGAAGWNIDDYPLGAKGTTVKPTTVKNVVKSATKDLDAAFNSPEQLKKDADYRAYRAGVKQSRKQPPAPFITKDVDEGWKQKAAAVALSGAMAGAGGVTLNPNRIIDGQGRSAANPYGNVDSQGHVIKKPEAPKADAPKEKEKPKPVKESYWTKLQNERNTKLNSLVNELKESVKK